MLYEIGSSWSAAKQKRISLIGMSGVGKTFIATQLRNSQNWFHYSVDYRIGTKYLGEEILDYFKKEAMRNATLKKHLMDDSIYISSNISFSNLSPLSSYLGKPGNTNLGGIPFTEYLKRQKNHFKAEIEASKDTSIFSQKAAEMYGYNHFISDTSGSLCEVVEPENPDDPVLKSLSKSTLIVWIKGSPDQTEELYKRFVKAPKPMYYKESFLRKKWTEFCDIHNITEDSVDPDTFMSFGFKALIQHRIPIYERIARNWGVTIDAETLSKMKCEEDFIEIIKSAIGN